MPQPSPIYVDGYVTPERQATVIPDVEFPFENYPTPDTYARLLSRRYDVTPKFFTPKIGVRTAWTNYLLYSATFANAAWTKTNITNTDNSLANPNDGTVTMASGLETVTNAEHAYQQAYTFTATAHTLSWVVIPNGRTWFRLKANDGTTNFTAFFQLTGSGVIGTTANCTAAVSLVSPTAYRISITFTPAAAAGNIYLNYSTDGSTVSYVGNTALGAYVWGAQIVPATSAGPVIITTAALRAVSSPNLDGDDPFAYLVYEQSPTNYTSAVAGVARKFARIPAPQTAFPGSRYFPLPSVTNDFGTGTSINVLNYSDLTALGAAAFQLAANSIYVSSQNSLYGPTKIQTAQIFGYATAGTFTLTYKTSTTTPLNYNDADSTIATAINLLASVIADGLTAVVVNDLSLATGGQLSIIWGGAATTSPVTMTSSMTVTTSNNPTTQIVNQINQTIHLPDHFTIASHGFNASLALAGVFISADAIYIYQPGYWGVIDGNTIWVPNINGSVTLYFGTFLRTYLVGGTYLLRTREVETFYLAGVTPGINTVADIQSPLGLQNPPDFLSAIITESGFQTYQSEGPKPWNGTLIYSVKTVDVNVDDF